MEISGIFYDFLFSPFSPLGRPNKKRKEVPFRNFSICIRSETTGLFVATTRDRQTQRYEPVFVHLKKQCEIFRCARSIITKMTIEKAPCILEWSKTTITVATEDAKTVLRSPRDWDIKVAWYDESSQSFNLTQFKHSLTQGLPFSYSRATVQWLHC